LVNVVHLGDWPETELGLYRK